MAEIVVANAPIMCKFCVTPGKLTLVPMGATTQTSGGQQIATVMDHVPMLNIMPFGACTSPKNPAAKNPSGQGPCAPATASPWSPGSATVTIAGNAVLTKDSTLTCALGGPTGGDISITSAGQASVTTG